MPVQGHSYIIGGVLWRVELVGLTFATVTASRCRCYIPLRDWSRCARLAP